MEKLLEEPMEAEFIEKELRQRNLKAKIVRLNPFQEHNFKSSKLKEVLPNESKQD